MHFFVMCCMYAACLVHANAFESTGFETCDKMIAQHQQCYESMKDPAIKEAIKIGIEGNINGYKRVNEQLIATARQYPAAQFKDVMMRSELTCLQTFDQMREVYTKMGCTYERTSNKAEVAPDVSPKPSVKEPPCDELSARADCPRPNMPCATHDVPGCLPSKPSAEVPVIPTVESCNTPEVCKRIICARNKNAPSCQSSQSDVPPKKPMEYAFPQLDGKVLSQRYVGNNLVEFIPEQETFENWSTMVAFRQHPIARKQAACFLAAQQHLKTKNAHPLNASELFENEKKHECTVRFLARGDDGEPGEFNVWRYVPSSNGVGAFSIQYAQKIYKPKDKGAEASRRVFENSFTGAKYIKQISGDFFEAISKENAEKWQYQIFGTEPRDCCGKKK